MRVEIECPYCGRIHVHLIATTPEVKPKVEEESLPVDEETGDLEEFQDDEIPLEEEID